MIDRRSNIGITILALWCIVSGASQVCAQPSDGATATLANPLEAQPLDRLSATRDRPLFAQAHQ